MAENYDVEYQNILLSMMLADASLFARCQNILKPQYFDKSLSKAVKFILSYSDEYKGLPNHLMIKANSGVELPEFPEDINESHTEWFLDNIERYCRHMALQSAILKSADLLEKNDYGQIEKIIKEAVTVGLSRDLGLSCFENPKKTIEDLLSENGNLSTGWSAVDKILYQVSLGELIIFSAGTGGGKSVCLANVALNAALNGSDVVYFTFELKQNLVAKRIYSMVSDIPGSLIVKDIDGMAYKVKNRTGDSGNLQIKYLKPTTNTNDIRAYLKEYQIKTGKKPQCVIIDYLDLMGSNSKRIDQSNVFQKDKACAEEVRALAHENNFIVYTASQLNRGGYDESNSGPQHISGGISKAFTCDGMISVTNNQQLRDKGKILFTFLKTRNSGGVGRVLEMEYNIDTLRISDPINEENENEKVVNSVIEKYKKKTDDINQEVKKEEKRENRNSILQRIRGK